MKNISFLSENFQFLEVKFSVYLNRRVFIMFLHENTCHVYSLKAPRRGASNEYSQHLFS